MSESGAVLQFLEKNRLRHYWMYSTIILLSCVIIFPWLIHIIIVKYNEGVLQEFTQNALLNSTQVSFQITEILNLPPPQNGGYCSEEDFENMREVLSKYYFLSDIGRVVNKEVLCTLMYRSLKNPPPLDYDSLEFDGEMYYGNMKHQQLELHSHLPFATRNNTITFISPLYIEDVSAFNQIEPEHFGGVIYSYDTQYTFILFGDADEHDINKAKNSGYKYFRYIPIPNQYTTLSLCNPEANVCVLALNKRLGLFRLPYFVIVVLIVISLLIGILLSTLMESYRSDTRILIRRLQLAIRKNRIYAVYQPKVNLASGKIVGVEALARWNDKTMGQVPPDTFITLAEQTGSIDKLTRNFISRSLTEIYSILEQYPKFKISFNISANLLINTQFIEFLTQEISRYSFKKDQIMLEITERISSNNQVMTSSSRKLNSIGFLISLDDFGTGFSNLAWLSTMEPYEIKVDKMFTQSIETDTINNLTLKGIFSMLEYLHVEVVFEGIENKEQHDYIKEKVPKAIGQGWHFYYPISIAELRTLLNGNERH